MGYDPNEPRDGRGRWGRMNSTSKAQLTSKARFVTNLAGPSKNSKGKAVGLSPKKVQGDERMFIKTSAGKTIPVWKYEDSPAAIAIQTAKALDKDFHHAKKKADQTAMHAALAQTKVPVIKYPSKKSKR